MCTFYTDVPAFSQSKKGHNSRKVKVVKSKIELALTFTVLDLVYIFKMV